jgi:hypothetical protein
LSSTVVTPAAGSLSCSTLRYCRCTKLDYFLQNFVVTSALNSCESLTIFVATSALN